MRSGWKLPPKRRVAIGRTANGSPTNTRIGLGPKESLLFSISFLPAGERESDLLLKVSWKMLCPAALIRERQRKKIRGAAYLSLNQDRSCRCRHQGGLGPPTPRALEQAKVRPMRDKRDPTLERVRELFPSDPEMVFNWGRLCPSKLNPTQRNALDDIVALTKEGRCLIVCGEISVAFRVWPTCDDGVAACSPFRSQPRLATAAATATPSMATIRSAAPVRKTRTGAAG